MFMATITYHGGQKSITYEWGDKLHMDRTKVITAPDHFAMKAIAHSMNDFSDGMYQVGSTNDVVYYVSGGMEEWSYAGTWFNRLSPVQTVPAVCQGGHQVKMTEVSNRCLTFLVESSLAKIPAEGLLGSTERLFMMQDVGMVNLLIRQCLLVLDILRPFAHQPLLEVKSEGEEGEEGEEKMIVGWSISGCFNVDTTEVRRSDYDDYDGDDDEFDNYH